jgi:hypothetical protein
VLESECGTEVLAADSGNPKEPVGDAITGDEPGDQIQRDLAAHGVLERSPVVGLAPSKPIF